MNMMYGENGLEAITRKGVVYRTSKSTEKNCCEQCRFGEKIFDENFKEIHGGTGIYMHCKLDIVYAWGNERSFRHVCPDYTYFKKDGLKQIIKKVKDVKNRKDS